MQLLFKEKKKSPISALILFFFKANVPFQVKHYKRSGDNMPRKIQRFKQKIEEVCNTGLFHGDLPEVKLKQMENL